jgi:ribonuclease HI
LSKTGVTTKSITSSSQSSDYTEIDLFTDGSCIGNPGPGGYGALIQYKVLFFFQTVLQQNTGLVVREKEVSGQEDDTTNNRMEITAAVKALEFLSSDVKCTINLYTDSKVLYIHILVLT